jgi:methionyl-tRNA formyltransferase
VVGISQLVPAAVRDLAKLGAVGFHPTLLPEGRGRAPVAWTILLQKPAAANLFFLTDEADAGDIIAQRPVEVRADDYAEDLIARTNVVLEQMVVDLAPAFASGRVPRQPQDHTRATYYARRRPEDGKIDWEQAAEEVYRLVRAAGRPYPGAFCFRGGRKVVVWRARMAEDVASSSCPPPGPPMVRGGEEMTELARGEDSPRDAIPCTPGGTRGVRDGKEGETPLPSFTPPSPPVVTGGEELPSLVTGGEAPGTVVAVLEEGPVVATARGRLVLTDIEMEGGEAPGISAGGWVIGERLT